ncbi:MAG: hypothetical protein WDM77_05650 [Steroidobacteraceae bacterium]
MRDENFTLLFNAHHDIMNFVVPPLTAASRWRVELQTATGTVGKPEYVAGGGHPGAPRPLHRAAHGSR